VAFGRSLYSVRDYGTLCLDCCVTSHNTTSFGHSLKTFFLSEYCIQRIRALATTRYTYLRFTYLLTYHDVLLTQEVLPAIRYTVSKV